MNQAIEQEGGGYSLEDLLTSLSIKVYLMRTDNEAVSQDSASAEEKSFQDLCSLILEAIPKIQMDNLSEIECHITEIIQDADSLGEEVKTSLSSIITKFRERKESLQRIKLLAEEARTDLIADGKLDVLTGLNKPQF